MGATSTTRICRTVTVASAAHSQRLVNVVGLKIVPSDRTFRALTICNRTKAVKAMVAPVDSPYSSLAQARMPSVRAAMMAPCINSTEIRWRLRMTASRARGRRDITPGFGTSVPRAMAGGPSMMMLIQSSWIAANGFGSPMSWEPTSVMMAPTLVATWNRTKVTMLS